MKFLGSPVKKANFALDNATQKSTGRGLTPVTPSIYRPFADRKRISPPKFRFEKLYGRTNTKRIARRLL